MANLIDNAIGIAVLVIILTVITIPIILTANTTGFGATDLLIFGFLTTFILIGLLMVIIKTMGVSRG